MSFIILSNEKTPFKAIKARSWNSRNIDIFPNGLTHGFGAKMAIFATFFLGNIGQENVFYGILERKNAFLGYKNKKFKKSKKWHFLNGLTHGFGPKMAIFPFFFFRQWKPGNFFYDILERKNAFLGYKKNKFINSKNWHFLKALTHGFGPKMAIFPTFFLGKIGQENVFYDILERKNVFLGYKNKNIKIFEKMSFFEIG